MKNDIIQIIKQRRSIRHYKNEQIKQAELETIIEAAFYAHLAEAIRRTYIFQ
jgi:nitroreductase